MRAFVAIALPPSVRELLAAARSALLDADPTWRDEKWVAPESLHLTLKFLGDVPAEDTERVAASIAGAVNDLTAFAIEAADIRAVPSGGRARMLWASFTDPVGAAARLAAAVEDATAPWSAEERPRKAFKPHATLVRARRPRRISPDALSAADTALAAERESGDASMSVRDVILLSSTLTPRGPVYEELARAPLSGD